MKKSIVLFAVALGVLTSCDPIKDEQDFDVTNISANDLLNGATFAQYADAAYVASMDDMVAIGERNVRFLVEAAMCVRYHAY